MSRFLESCADYIHDRFRKDFSTVTVVVPNHRAALFFSAYLKRLLTRPVIAPNMVTIHELMLSLSDLLPADQLTLVAYLFEAWREVTGYNESFDSFYFWGEVLLADFDDLDKYQVKSDDLFRNLASLKEAGSQFDYLSEEQKKMLHQFWGSLGRWEEFRIEKEFISFWEVLPLVYSRFRELLIADGLGYSGMIIRDGVEAFLSGKKNLADGSYVIIGMNALNSCEKKLFSRLRDAGRALFLWDYDHFYLDDPLNNAGRFIRENLILFPPPPGFTFQPDRFPKPKEIELVAVASPTGQAQVIPESLGQERQGEICFDDTAIVLADESLLFPVLGAIPPEWGKVNVTMGYPVQNSPVVSLLLQAMALTLHSRSGGEQARRLYFRPVYSLLTHPFLSPLEPQKVTAAMQEFREKNRIYLAAEELFFSPLHRLVFSLPSRVEEYCGYLLSILQMLYNSARDGDPVVKEMIWQIYKAVEKFESVMEGILARGKSPVSPQLFYGFLSKYLSMGSVAFEGEPLSGLQVMGILETRCLDFDNLIIIGLNEDVWPKTTAIPSLVPYNLRKAFGLPGIDDQEAMYAYYFYRLVQRARKVTATWSSVREGISGGELSRYGFQLKYRSPHKVKERAPDFPFGSHPPEPVEIHGGTMVSEQLLATNLKTPLSPSAINSFLECKLKFYFRYVARLRERDEISEDIDRQDFGNIFHKAAESLYRPDINRMLDFRDLEKIKKEREKIVEVILRAMASEYYKVDPEQWSRLEVEGKALLIRTTVLEYLQNLLSADLRITPFRLHDLERRCETSLEIAVGGSSRKVRIGGMVDRIDEKNGVVRVVDYKTGALQPGALTFGSVEELFEKEAKTIKKEVIQALIYSFVLHQEQFKEKQITAAVYSIVNLRNESFRMNVEMNKAVVSLNAIEAELEVHLRSLLEEIYSPDTIFTQTPFLNRCKYCPYNLICRRT